MDVLSGDDAFQKALETLPGGEPAPTTAQAGPAQPEQEQPHFEALDGPVLARLASYAGNRAVSRLLARQPAPGTTDPPVAKTPETVKVKVRWDKTDPPQKYLKDAFTGHPVDWKAEVFVDGKSVGSGDGSLEVDMVKDSKHDVRVVPTPASKDLDYYEPRTVTLKKAAAGDFDVRLGYNRENQYFTDESWEGRHRPREGGQGQVGRPAGQEGDRQRAGHPDGRRDQQALQRQDQGHRRGAQGDHRLAGLDRRLQPPHDELGQLQQPLHGLRGRHQREPRDLPEHALQEGRGRQEEHAAPPGHGADRQGGQARVGLELVGPVGRDGARPSGWRPRTSSTTTSRSSSASCSTTPSAARRTRSWPSSASCSAGSAARRRSAS